MKKILRNNWWLKLIALAFSIVLWLTITNTTDPEKTYQITGIPIEFLNEDSIYDAGMTYYVEGADTTSVEVSIRESKLKNISASDFKATVDLSKRYGQTGYVELDIEVVNNQNLLEGNYKQLTYAVFIRTEAVKTETFTIEPAIEGTLDEGYNYSEIRVEPRTVDITAPESLLEQISHVVVPVRLEGNTEDIVDTGTLVLYNTEGKIINLESEPEIKLGITEAKFYISVLKVNTLPIVVEVTGAEDVAEGYRYISYECDVKSIAVAGESTLVDRISNIIISGEAVDVTGIDSDKTVSVDINDYLPEGISVAGNNNIISILLKVEPLEEKGFSIAYDNVIINGRNAGYEYSIVGSGAVSVVVIGLAEDLASLDADDVKLSLDVSDYGPGEYIVTLTAEQLEGYDIKVLNSVVVRITDTEINSSEDISSSQGAPDTSVPETEENESDEISTEESAETSNGET